MWIGVEHPGELGLVSLTIKLAKWSREEVHGTADT